MARAGASLGPRLAGSRFGREGQRQISKARATAIACAFTTPMVSTVINKKLRPALLFLTLLGVASAVQAHANLVHGIAADHMASRGSSADKSVEAVEYRNRTFLLKRTVPQMLTGAGINQILFLQAQLDLCKIALSTDSTSAVFPPARQNTISTMAAEIANIQTYWPLKAYR